MKWLIAAIAVVSLALTGTARAFKGSRCSKLYDAGSYMGKNERAILKLFLATTSTGQFITSTGQCKMIGGISGEQRELFIASNAQQLMRDIARAEGEHLAAVAFLYGCRPAMFGAVATRLQESAERFFQAGENGLSRGLHSFMKTDPVVQGLCVSGEGDA